jgi:CBS domain-containing protein
MKAKDLMTGDPGFCLSGDTLKKAAEIMSERDCGFVPVVDAEMVVTGVITGRDICIALARRSKKASEINAGEIAGSDPVCCRPDDKIKDVLKVMKKKRVRRLPVRDGDKRLVGVLTIRDIIHASERDKSLRKRTYSVLRELAKPRSIVLFEIPD